MNDDKTKQIFNSIKLMMTNTKLLSEFLSMIKLGNNIGTANDLRVSAKQEHSFVAYQLYLNNFQELFIFLDEYYFKNMSECKPSSAELIK